MTANDLIYGAKPPSILVPFVEIEDIIWSLNSENYADSLAKVLNYIKNKSVPVTHVLKSLVAAGMRRWRSFKNHLDMFDHISKLYPNIKLDNILTQEFKCILYSKDQEREFYINHIYENEALNAIAFDDIDTFTEIVQRPNFIYPREVIGKTVLNCLDFAAFHGSLTCFLFLQVNNFVPTSIDMPLSMCGGNPSVTKTIERALDTSNPELGAEKYKGCFKYAVKYHWDSMIDLTLKNYDGRKEINAFIAMNKYFSTKAAYFLSMNKIVEAIPKPLYKLHDHQPFDEFVAYFAYLNDLEMLEKLVKTLNLSIKHEDNLYMVEVKKRMSQIHSFYGNKQIMKVYEEESFNYHKSEYPPMVHALLNQNLDMLIYLIPNGASINFTFNYNGIPFSPLSYAIKTRNEQFASLLIAGNANIFYLQRDGKRKTSTGVVENYYSYEMFLYAVKYDMLEIAKKCISRGASMLRNIIHVEEDNAYPTLMHTPLMFCAKKGYMDLVIACIDAKADVNTRFEKYPNYYMSPLKYACKYGHFEIAKYLIEKGANPDDHLSSSSRYAYNTPIALAVRSGNLDLVKLLLSKGASLHHIIKRYSRFEVRQNGSLLTCLDLAQELGHQEIFEFLQSHGAVPIRECYTQILKEKHDKDRDKSDDLPRNDLSILTPENPDN